MTSHTRKLTDLPGRVLLLVGVAVAAAAAAMLTLNMPRAADAASPVVPGFSSLSTGGSHTGESHTCALLDSGTVECWGRNRWGQTDAPAGQFSAVSAGGDHTCGLRETGAVQCWGRNDTGQANAPAGRFSAVSAGWAHTCGLRETGAVECWGDNSDGQTDAPAGRFSAVSAGEPHTCGLRETGMVECWGSNGSGRADAPAGRFSAVSAGSLRTCGLRETGAVECWRRNGGQADAPAGRFSAVSAGEGHTCGLRETGAVVCWGYNRYGQTDAPAGRFSAVSAGGGHTCGLRETGAVECWGANYFGQADAPNGLLTGCRYVELGNVTGGVQRSGRWTATDCERSGRLYDVYRFTVGRVSDVDWRLDGRDADSALRQEDHRRRAGSQRLMPGTYWLAVSGSVANADKELPYTLTLEVQPSDLTLDFTSPTRCAVTDLGETRGALTRRGAWTQSDCEDGGRYSDWYAFSLPPLGLPEDAGQRPLTIDVLSPDADSLVTRAQCASDYRADPPVNDDATLGTLGTSGRCFLTDDDSGDGVNARLSWDVRTDTTRLIYWIRVDTSDYGPATGSYTLRITASEPAAGAPPSYSADNLKPAASAAAGRIVARRLSDGRTEFGWLPSGATEHVLPRGRYFPVDAQVDRWLNSTPVEVDGVALGRINARLRADGRIEFAFTPTSGARILPPSRYFPLGATVDRWLRSTEIDVGGG